MEVADGPCSTLIVSISSVLTLERKLEATPEVWAERPAFFGSSVYARVLGSSGLNCTPSITYSGWLVPLMELKPRIIPQGAAPGGPLLDPTFTFASLPCNAWSNVVLTVFCRSAAVTVTCELLISV